MILLNIVVIILLYICMFGEFIYIHHTVSGIEYMGIPQLLLDGDSPVTPR